MDTLTVMQLSEYLQTSSSTVRRLIKKNNLPYFKVGNTIKFNKSSIDKWIEKQELINYKEDNSQ